MASMCRLCLGDVLTEQVVHSTGSLSVLRSDPLLDSVAGISGKLSFAS